MTVSSLEPVNNYAGNNYVRTFDFDFLIENEQELKVSLLDLDTNMTTELVFGVDYSINEVGNKNGSFIIFPLQFSTFEVLKENQVISLSLSLPIKQESEFENSSDLKLDVLEWTFDYIVRLLQILNRQVERAVKIPEGSDFSSGNQLVSSIFASSKNVEDGVEFVAKKAEETFKNAQNTVSALKNVENKANNNLDNLTEDGINLIKEYIGKGLPIGSVYTANSASTYVPEGSLPCDGSEYTKSQFEQLWEKYFITNLLNTCSYSEYESEISANGYCSKFAFKPLVFDGTGLNIYGSPTITEEGLASGFNSGNYITANINIENASVLKITTKFKYVNSSSSQILYWLNNCGLRLTQETNGAIALYSQNGSVFYQSKISFGSPTEGDEVFAELVVSPTKAELKLTIDEQSYTFTKSDLSLTLSSTLVGIGSSYYQGNTPFLSTIDLKEFSITVDGEKVFSCGVGNTFKVPLITSENIDLKKFVVVSNEIINESQMNWGEWASNLQGKANNDLSNCTKPYIIETSDETLMPSWYRIWSDGWCEQGGIATGGITSSGKQVSLLKNLKDNYSLRVYVLGRTDSFNAAGTWAKARAITNASFYLVSGYTGASTSEYTSFDCSWEAKGYLL